MATTTKRRRSAGRYDPTIGLIVLDGHVRLVDLASLLHWPLTATTERLAEYGVEARPKDGFPYGRWVAVDDARRFLAGVRPRKEQS